MGIGLAMAPSMNMSMGLNLRLRLTLRCEVCGEYVDESASNGGHAHGCPAFAREVLAKAIKRWSCPQCPGSCELDEDDFFQCRKCKTRYSSGEIGDVPEPANLPETILFYRGPDDDMPSHTKVRVLHHKGLGVFKPDRTLEELRRQEVVWRKATRDKRRKQVRVELAEKARERARRHDTPIETLARDRKEKRGKPRG